MPDQPKPRVAPPPGLGTCSTCRCFVKELALEVAVMDLEGRSMPREAYDAARRQAVQQGATATMPKALAIMRTAPCSRMPAWEMCPEVHWCWEWQRAAAGIIAAE